MSKPQSKYSSARIGQLKAYRRMSSESHVWPSLGRFAKAIGVSLRTIRSWRNTHPEFEAAVRDFRDYQRQVLAEDCMTGKISYSLAAKRTADLERNQ